jgi:hypothetical protein
VVLPDEDGGLEELRLVEVGAQGGEERVVDVAAIVERVAQRDEAALARGPGGIVGGAVDGRGEGGGVEAGGGASMVLRKT